VRHEGDRTTYDEAVRLGEDGGLHAGVRHDRGLCRKSWRVKGGRYWERESSWKSGGDEHVLYSRWAGR
jgi:hypothetical protein